MWAVVTSCASNPYPTSLRGQVLTHSYRKENIRRSVDRCIAALRGTKKIDMFQPARIAKGTNVEETIHILVQLLQEGKFDHLRLSECSAQSLRRAHAVRSLSLCCGRHALTIA